MRKNLPAGLYGHNLNPETLECPVCYSHLIPAELVYKDNNAELWIVECRNCHTEYMTTQPIGKLSIPQPITRDYIFQLEERILRLESLVIKLRSLRSEKTTPKEDIPNQYAFLLNT